VVGAVAAWEGETGKGGEMKAERGREREKEKGEVCIFGWADADYSRKKRAFEWSFMFPGSRK
jgi:hypothetical protein